MEMKKNFYDSPYWEEGFGLELVQLRRLTSLVMFASNDKTPPPFITKDEDDSTIWYYSWGDIRTTGMLHMDYENTALSIFSTSISSVENPTVDFGFWYDFGEDDEKNHGWDHIDEAVQDMRSWLQKNADALSHKDNKASAFEMFKS